MGHGAGAPVIVDNRKGGAADRVGAAQAFGQAAAEGGFACAQPAGKGDDRPVGEDIGQAAAQRGGLLGGAGDEFSHVVTSKTKMQRPGTAAASSIV